jgi:iron complex transport system ATP-binding protein
LDNSSTISNKSVLELKALEIGYSHSLWNTPLSLKVGKGELIIIAGPNGAGKSTLLRTLAGLHKPISGIVYLQDEDLTALTAIQRAKKMAVVLTSMLGVSEMKVSDYLDAALFASKGWFPKAMTFRNKSGKDLNQNLNSEKELISKNAALFGITKLLNNPLYALSDGQRQGVRICAAFVQQTPLILLDEPSHHLDVAHRARLFTMLQKLCKQEKKTMLISTHEIEWALQIADRMVIASPELLQIGTPEQIIDSGILNEVYGRDAVRFDPQSKRFIPIT